MKSLTSLKIKYNIATFYILPFFLFFPLLHQYPLYAAEITSVKDLSFGVIIADPLGERIEIDASSGPSEPQKVTTGGSHITGGTSGMIRISSTNAGQQIQIDYLTPSTVLNSNGNTMQVDGINARSTPPTVTTTGSIVDIHVGGMLHIKPGQAAGAYSGLIEIMITYH